MGGRRQQPGRVITRSAPLKNDPKRKRYTAMYWHAGKEISAGTFDTYDQAEAAWLRQADTVRRGNHIDPSKSRMLFSDFVELYRMTRHVERTKTALSQDSTIRTHLLTTFGTFQLREIDTIAVDIRGHRERYGILQQ
jgi:hypothetical protein